MIVVPVLITSCQVFEYLNNGPVVPHMTINKKDSIKEMGVPTTYETLEATLWNTSRIGKGIVS